jgi:hypothetical protein
MLHGEHYLEVLRPIGNEGTLEVHCKVADVLDKGSGTVVLVQGESRAYTKLRVISKIFWTDATGHVHDSKQTCVKTACVHPATCSLAHRLTRHGGPTINQCFTLPQLPYGWWYQSGIFWIYPRMRVFNDGASCVHYISYDWWDNLWIEDGNMCGLCFDSAVAFVVGLRRTMKIIIIAGLQAKMWYWDVNTNDYCCLLYSSVWLMCAVWCVHLGVQWCYWEVCGHSVRQALAALWGDVSFCVDCGNLFICLPLGIFFVVL